MRTVVLCPFTAGAVLWQTQSGAWTLSVCVRGTFSLFHGREAVLADTQEPVAGDRWAGDDLRLGLFSPSDLVPYKPRVDVLLVGSAFAPDKEPVEALVARVAIGPLDKSIGVIGDRTWIDGPDGPEPSAPRPFRSMPLGHDRAAKSRENPHGFDLAARPRMGAPALPNLEAADDDIGGARTVGLGPVAPAAAPRRGLLSAAGWAWASGGGRGPAPEGLDFAFYNAAPRDQQIDAIEGNERLVLVNLNREHPHLETRLPEVRPKVFLVSPEMDRSVEIQVRCDTLWIDTDRALIALSWRGVVSVQGPDEDALGTLVVAAAGKGRDVSWEQIEKLLRDGGTTVSTDGDTFTTPQRVAPVRMDIDPDIMPTPGRILLKRPLPAVGAAPPVAIVAEEEPTQRDPDPAPLDDPKTETRTDVPRRAMDSLGDEPSTRPMLVRPTPPATMGPQDYARIAAAVERGEAVDALFYYGLAVPDLPRLEREWREKSAADPEFAEAFAKAVAEQRRR